MKKLFVILCVLLTITSLSAQDFNKWSIEPEFGLTKVRDITKVGFFNTGVGVRYMATPIFGVKLSGSYTHLNYPIEYVSGQVMGVCNFGRLAKLERVANNRWTIVGGIGGDYTDSRNFTNTVILHRISDFHLAGYVDNEFRITDKFFITAGLNVTTGVNSRPEYTPYNRTMTTSIIDFNVKAIFVLGKKKSHADFYLEPMMEPCTNVYYVDSSKVINNNYVQNVTNKNEPEKISAEYVYFYNNSYVIDKDGLENIEQSLNKFKNAITITAYCSNIASSEYNLKLAQNRGNAVKNKLVKLGINESKIKVISVGIDKSREYDMARRVKIEFE